MVFTVELFYELLSYKSSFGLPTFSFWRNKVEFYSLFESFDTPFERQNWKKKKENYAGLINQVFVEFCKLLNIPTALFKCCENPEVVNIDGIVTSIETKHIKNRTLEEPSFITASRRSTTRFERNILDLTDAQRLELNEYLTTGLSASKWDSLLMEIPEPAKSLLVYSSWQVGIAAGSVHYCRDIYSVLVVSFVKKINPCIQFCPITIWSSWDNFLNDNSNTHQLQLDLRKYAPMFYKLFNYYLEKTAINSLEANVIIEFLKYVVQKTKDLYSTSEDNELRDLLHNLSNGDDRYTTGKYFPGRPTIRQLPTQTTNNPRELEVCSKHAKHNTKLSGGVILYWCGKHRQCIGWHMVPNVESPKLVYEVLTSRFSVMPKVKRQ
jgi:hypothetical protein